MNKLKLSILAFCAAAMLNSCNKKETTTPVPVPNTTAKQSDQAGSAEVDDALTNVNNFISNEIGGGSSQTPAKISAAYNLPCGVVGFDTTQKNTSGNLIYSLTYGDNTPCGYKYISGNIKFQLINGKKFSDTGAVFQIVFTNYKVTVKVTGSVVTLNGTLTATNKTGGYIWQAINANTISHSIRGTLNITYANGAIRPKNYFQKRTWTSTSGWAGLSFTVAGDSTTSNQTVISETGNTYDGNYAYQTELPTPFVWQNSSSTYAGPYVLTQGHGILNVTGAPISPATIDVTAGYYWNYLTPTSTPTLINNTTANAYKIVTTISVSSYTSYQLY